MYTYLLKFTNPEKDQKLFYYGVRFAKNSSPDDLFKTYFTSSKYVRELINKYGVGSFTWEIRKTFLNKEEALEWEHTVLRRMKVVRNDLWLNRTDNKAIFNKIPPRLGVPTSQEVKNKISSKLKGNSSSQETRKKMSDSQKGTNKPKSKENIKKARDGYNNYISNLDEEGKKARKEIAQKVREVLCIIETPNKEIIKVMRLKDYCKTVGIDHSSFLKYRKAKGYKLLYREDGKLLKGDNYSPADIKSILNA